MGLLFSEIIGQSSQTATASTNEAAIAELQAATAVSPDPAISLESTTVGAAVDELAEDIHDLNNAPDFTLLFLNSLV